MTKNVYSEVVSKGRCCGCGICGAIPKKECIAIKFNKIGEYAPSIKDCTSCGLCLSVCPFYVRENASETVAFKNDIANFIGYSNIAEERSQGSSGGLTTRILRSLFDKKLIDGAIVVGRSDSTDKLFEPILVTDSADLIKYAGSKYYPIEFSVVLKKLATLEGRYAIVALPCVIQGLRLYQKRFPEIGKKIGYLVGLVCGHNKNKNYTTCLLDFLEVSKEQVASVEYRSKEGSQKASNYGFRGVLKGGGITRAMHFSSSVIKDLWCKRYFSLSGCFHCRDLFADHADVSCMDAWLKPYMDNPAGTSIIVVRNEQIKDLLQSEERTNQIVIEPIAREQVIKSQAGGLAFKQTGFSNKLGYYLNRKFSNFIFILCHGKKTLRQYLLTLHIRIFQ